MKKNKKYYFPSNDEKLTSSDLSNIIKESFDTLYWGLGFEKSIEIKKDDGIPLTDKDLFFDNFVLKPSFSYRMIERMINRK